MFTRIAWLKRWRITRARHHFSTTAICVGDEFLFRWISDHHEGPVLRIGSRWRLHGNIDAVRNHLWLNLTGKV